MKFSRRRAVQALGAVGFAPAFLSTGCSEQAAEVAEATDLMAVKWPPTLGDDVPKICLGGGGDETRMRQYKQVGVDYVLGGGGPAPWTVESLRERMDRAEASGIRVINLMIGGIGDVIHGGSKAAEQTQNVIESIRAAGEAGLPVIEYNFYAHRLVEGYYEEIGRAGAGYTAYGYDRVLDGEGRYDGPEDKGLKPRDLPPREGIGTHTRADQLKRARAFLEAVVPEAEKANVRLALHPNDPPVPISRGSEQLFATLDHWKEYLDLVKSPYNGITYDCGVSTELGEDAPSVCRYLGERDVINHVHFRNVVVRKPYIDYTEVFIDEGVCNMFAVMLELVRQKYPRGLYPEHPRALDIDRELGALRGYPGGGGLVALIYNVAYTKAMLQAALTLQGA
jgi:mannonate dehydratase